jgi:hypothetical protein
MRSAKASSNVAKPSSSGMMTLKVRSGVRRSSTAPAAAPAIEAMMSWIKSRLNFGSCERSDSAASMVPGMMETMLATAAGCGGMPTAIMAG